MTFQSRPSPSDASHALDPDLVEKLVRSASESSRHGLRNALIVQLMYGHALRLAETVDLCWGHVDLHHGRLRFTRRRSGLKTTRNLTDDELHALRDLRGRTRHRDKTAPVFQSSSGERLTPDAVRKAIATAADKAGIRGAVGPRILRRSAGMRVGAITRDVDAVRALLGVGLRVSAVSAVPVLSARASKRRANPWA